MASTNNLKADIASHIYCAVCQRPVDRAAYADDLYHDEILYKVWCHGDEDNCRIPNSFFLVFNPKDLVAIEAFATKRFASNQSKDGG
jgi:hypothetical protein